MKFSKMTAGTIILSLLAIIITVFSCAPPKSVTAKAAEPKVYTVQVTPTLKIYTIETGTNYTGKFCSVLLEQAVIKGFACN